MSDRYNYIGDDEELWLESKRRAASRRSWLLIVVAIVVLVLAAILVAWLWDSYGPGGQAATTTTITTDQRVKADGQQALADWGRFGVTGDLRTLKDSFWPDGPQYKLLAKEAEKHPKPIGPPAYTVTMPDPQVKPVNARPDERVLRGKVSFTRPGEASQTFNWDVWMRRDDASGGRWRLWTVRETAPR